MHRNGVACLCRRGLLGRKKFADTFVLVGGFYYRGWMERQGRPQSRRNCQCVTRRIVNGDSFDALALPVTLHQALQVFFLAPLEQPFDAFLKAVGEDLCAAVEVIAQNSPLVPHLITSKEQRHTSDAHDQGQDDFQSRAHRSPQSN